MVGGCECCRCRGRDWDGLKVSAVVGGCDGRGNGRAVVLDWSATVGDGRRCECCRCRGRDRDGLKVSAVVGRCDGRGNGRRFRWSALSGVAGVAVGIGTA